jgi:hypothetical protein
MPISETLFDDILPTDEPGENVSATRVTIVQLSIKPDDRVRFMKYLHRAIAGQYSEAALTPIPEHEGHAIGSASERFIRQKLNLKGEANDLAWCKKLLQWGAINPQILATDAFKSLLDRRRTPPKQTVPSKVFLASKRDAFKPLITPKSTTKGIQLGSLAASANPTIDWHLDPRGANVVAAWQKFLSQNPGSTLLPWKDIRIGHLDTGYIPHEALAWSDNTSTTVLHQQGRDYFDIPQDLDPKDAWIAGNPGHGTRIDGSIAGFDLRDASRPFYGAAPGVQVIPYRVTDSIMVDHVQSNIAQAIDLATNDGCQIITICLGALRGSKRVADAVNRAYEKGVIVVCAAGQIWPWVIYPGRFNRVMTVSGFGLNGTPWGSAACGAYVDWCGPSDEIRRLKIQPKDNGYETGINPKADGDGTSYATAITSGIAALWLAWHGADKIRAKYAGQEWMIPAAFKLLVKRSAKTWEPGSSGSAGYGVGKIDAFTLLNQPLPDLNSLKIESRAEEPFDPNH